MRPITRIVAPVVVGMLLAFLGLPLLGLATALEPSDLLQTLARSESRSAILLSLQTSALALGVSLCLGTPAAWWLSRGRGRVGNLALVALELPIVLPPAVLGVGLLETFGRSGLFGPALSAIGASLPFSTAAVVLAQFLVGCPLYTLIAAAAFRIVDDDLLLVARTLGASPTRAWLTVALPAAAPGLLSAAALAWARSLGEFGATLMFAGNLPGTTQTMPLAIYEALERSLTEATALSIVLVALALGLLVAVRAVGGRGLRAL